MKRKRATPITHMGPYHQAKTRSASDPHKQNHLTLTSQTTRALPIPERTHSTRNNTPIQEPLHHIVLLHQKEEQEASTSSRLPASELMDHQKPLPLAPDPVAN